MINQETKLCLICVKNNADHNHHFIPRDKLTSEEVLLDKFTIPTCSSCHTEFHSGNCKNGYKMYVEHNLLFHMKIKCGNDPRYITTIEALRAGSMK